jgi:hypothetical protein
MHDFKLLPQSRQELRSSGLLQFSFKFSRLCNSNRQKHISIKPTGTGKHFSSLLLAARDMEYWFLCNDVGNYRKPSDSTRTQWFTTNDKAEHSPMANLQYKAQIIQFPETGIQGDSRQIIKYSRL